MLCAVLLIRIKKGIVVIHESVKHADNFSHDFEELLMSMLQFPVFEDYLICLSVCF